MRVRRLAAASATALLLPFAACSDGESSAEPTEPTSSATPSPSETASEGPTLPPAAQGDDEAAAKAFVEFYFELISDAMVTGDTSAVRQFSTPNCRSCNALLRNLEKPYDKGGRFETSGWRATKLATDPVPEKDQIAFLARVEMKPRVLYDGDGSVVTRSPQKTQAMHLLLRRSSGTWQMLRMGLL